MVGVLVRDRSALAYVRRRLMILGVRLGGDRGYVLLGAKTVTGYMRVHVDGGAWKLSAVVYSGLP